MAQLGERRVRIAEAEGSNPFGSTNKKRRRQASFLFGGDRGAHTFMQATGFTSDLTRWGNPQTVPPSHCPLPCGGAGRVGGLFWRSLGSKDFFMFTIEWVLTTVSDCGTMSVVVDVSEFPDCSTIFIWTTIEWVLTAPVSCAILAVQRSTTVFRLGNWSPSR